MAGGFARQFRDKGQPLLLVGRRYDNRAKPTERRHSGLLARIGLAEELKPYFKVAWNDPANEANGYKYLYLTEEDLAKLPEGVVSGEFITEGGEKRYKLDYIVGEKDGIGVENLRGSGLIAGETSQAHAQTEPEPPP